MILDLSPIVNNEGKRLNIDALIDLGQNDADICFKAPVKLCGTLANIGGSLELSATLEAQLDCVCDRCLERYEKTVRCSFEEVLKKESMAEEDQNPDAVYFQGSSIELDELVLNNIILSMPIKSVCSEDCKGLCPKCGQNLNISDCGCDTRSADPRFDVLDKFFK